ncbi:hypothetical protein MSIMFI_05343 [Mycobacterium simulans]|nr:hypothetical protein MSIMFI_05343 [Mycobacterium simulans]
MQILRNNAVLDGQYRLHQRQRSSRRLRMAKIGLYRPQRAPAVDSIYLGHAGVFDGIADRSPSAMRLHHADGGRVHASRGQRRAIHLDLRLRRRRREIGRVTILVGSRATHHSQNPVTIPLRIRQPLEQQNDASLADDEPIRRDIERQTASLRRQHAHRRVRGEPPGFKDRVDTGREGKVTFAVLQAPAGQVRCIQAGRAGSIDRHRGTAEP